MVSEAKQFFRPAHADPLDRNCKLVVGKVERTYIVHCPASAGEEAMPLLFAFHGGGGKGIGMIRLTHLNKIADEKHFIVAYPDGANHHWNDGRAINDDGVDDIAFVRAMVEEICKNYRVDRSRIYATGISNGGFFSQRLACQAADLIAAVASVAASTTPALVKTCVDGKPVPIMFVLGTNDPIVPFAGGQVGGRFLGDRGLTNSAGETVAYWLKRNHCQSAPKVTDFPEQSGMHARRELYSPEQGGSPVLVYTVEGGGHTWPGGMQYLPERFIGKTCRSFDAGEEIWKFLSEHKL
jgi:polyhydroxybutyrate depolymerase